jgi:ceramide glucosyltransferase
VKDLDVEFDANVAAGLDHGYPGSVQTLFVFDDEREPGVRIVRKQVEQHRAAGESGSADLLFCGAPPPGRTGKLNAMIHALRYATGEVIVFADSDIRTNRDSLRVVVETLLGSERAGSSFAPVVVSEPCRTLWDAVCAMMLNGFYTPFSNRVLRQRGGDLPFILGQLMALSRDAIDAIGGLEQASGQIVDDLYIGQLVEKAGLRNVASPEPIRIVQYGLSAREGVQRYQRWLTFSRNGIPQWSFKLPIIYRASFLLIGLVGGIAAVGVGLPIAGVALLALAAGIVASFVALYARTGAAPLEPRHFLAPLVIIALAPWSLFKTHVLQRKMAWRGRVYELASTGELASGPPPREPVED